MIYKMQNVGKKAKNKEKSILSQPGSARGIFAGAMLSMITFAQRLRYFAS